MNYQPRIVAALCVALLSSPAGAALISLPTTLDQVLPDGDFVMVGDLTFDEFSYIASGDMPIPTQIGVEEIPGGLRFTGPFLDLPGGAGNGASDATLGYTVTAPGGISEVFLRGNPSLLGGSGNASVTETFAGFPTIKLDVYDETSGTFLEDSANLGTTVNRLTVIKDILLFTTDDIRAATLSVIDQVVPEPAGLTLALFGILGLGVLRRSKPAAAVASSR